MNKLAEILEKWAELHPAIKHDPARGSKDKAYYNIKAISNDSEFVRNQNTAKSPCMAYSVLIDAEMSSAKIINYQHHIYFMSKAKTRSLAKNAKQDDDLAVDEQKLMNELVIDLLLYLRELKHNGRCPLTGQQYDAQTIQMLRGLSLERANWGSLPIKYAEWHIMELAIDQDQALPACFNREKYNYKQ